VPYVRDNGRVDGIDLDSGIDLGRLDRVRRRMKFDMVDGIGCNGLDIEIQKLAYLSFMSARISGESGLMWSYLMT
jgi:hypothetical protein